MIATTSDALISPVSAQSLADWLKMDDASDPILPSLLLSATDCVINWIQRDLLIREWQVTYHDWPHKRQGRNLHYGWPGYQDGLELPYTQLVSVESVTVYGELLDTEDYEIINGNPAKVRFKKLAQVGDGPAIVVNYKAGFEDVPQAIKKAIVMIAAYMHAHAGSCDASAAMSKSGAAVMLHPYRARAGLAL